MSVYHLDQLNEHRDSKDVLQQLLSSLQTARAANAAQGALPGEIRPKAARSHDLKAALYVSSET